MDYKTKAYFDVLAKKRKEADEVKKWAASEEGKDMFKKIRKARESNIDPSELPF